GRRGLEPLPVGPVQRQRRLARPRRPGPQPPPLDRTPRPRRPRARRRQDPPVPLPQPPRPRHTLRPTRNTSPSAELALEDTVLRRAGSTPSRPGRRLTPPAPTQHPRHGDHGRERLNRNAPQDHLTAPPPSRPSASPHTSLGGGFRLRRTGGRPGRRGARRGCRTRCSGLNRRWGAFGLLVRRLDQLSWWGLPERAASEVSIG